VSQAPHRQARGQPKFPIPLPLLWVVVSTLLSLLPLAALAAEDEQLRVPPPPDLIRNKSPIPAFILKEKREGSYFTGIPVIGSDPESGVQLGANIEWYDNGSKESPFFSYAPYRKKISVTADASTNGRQEYILEYDQPYIADSSYRLRAYGAYFAEKFADYFGIGESTLGRLSFPGTPGVTYRRIDQYFNALQDIRDGKTWARFNYYDRRQPVFVLNLERDLWGGLLRPLIGLQISHVDARDYTGSMVDNAVNQDTLLRQDYQNGKIRGFDGGWLNFARLGLTYDSRDYEPDPTSGIVGQALLEGTARWLGANSDFGHLTLGFQGYHRLFPDLTRLVLAANLAYSAHFGVVPFYAMPSLAVPGDEGKEGLGGWSTLRGYYANRFVGKVEMHGTLELRWTPLEFNVLKQNLRTQLVPFVDAGRVFDKIARFSVNDWKVTGGIGLRLIWNLATIISFDVGFSKESTLFYLELGQQF
jgi:outer membrane protein assembly factor BamA